MTTGSEARGTSLQRTLHHQVANQMGARIVRGELPPGTALPNESLLGAQLGVSRTVLREAMKVLASKALVTVRPKTGTRVRPREEWNMLDPDILHWQSSGSNRTAYLEDLMEVRRIIEPAAARLAAKRARSQDISKIERAWALMDAARGDSEASIDPDLRFHLTVLAATHNVFMRPFGSLIEAALKTSFRLTNVNATAYRRSLRQHREVLDAIRAGDADLAERLMRDFLADVHDDIRQALPASCLQRKRVRDRINSKGDIGVASKLTRPSLRKR